uniref:Uncharacterized protein n=1 Tax=virus sp. ctmTa7 TaxID=2828255 RepID=A0A8S5RCB4_9VIRU|nr:MAG TPA: hypothetical protein [virus sp. ctmTa7]
MNHIKYSYVIHSCFYIQSFWFIKFYFVFRRFLQFKEIIKL